MSAHRLSIYGCLATGDCEGLIEIVVGAETIADIQRKYAGILKSFNKKCLYHWLKEQNDDDKRLVKYWLCKITISLRLHCTSTHNATLHTKLSKNATCPDVHGEISHDLNTKPCVCLVEMSTRRSSC